MNQEKELVLGSGASALVYLFYHKNAFALAGKQIGGLFAQAQNIGPQYIWKTPSTTSLLTDMGYFRPESKRQPVNVSTIRIGYLWKGKVVRLEDLNPFEIQEIQKLYALKTRGISPEKSHMSSGKSEFEIYSLPVQELVEDLLKMVSLRLLPFSADKIDLYRKQITIENGRITYDRLISTIPAPIFLKLIERESLIEKLKAFDKAYVRDSVANQVEHTLRTSNQNSKDSGTFDYVYIPGDEYIQHRVRWLGGLENEVIREYTLKEPIELHGKAIINHKQGQIVGGHEILESLPDSVKLLGRYAQWKHGIRLENVLDQIYTEMGAHNGK